MQAGYSLCISILQCSSNLNPGSRLLDCHPVSASPLYWIIWNNRGRSSTSVAQVLYDLDKCIFFFFFLAVSLLIFCTGLHNSTNVSIRLHYQLPTELEQCERSYGSQCKQLIFSRSCVGSSWICDWYRQARNVLSSGELCLLVLELNLAWLFQMGELITQCEVNCYARGFG